MADPTTVPTGIQPNLPAALSELGAALLLPALLVAVIAYFCGCFNGAVIVSKYILRDDVRTHGSGNAGLTNFYRTCSPVCSTLRGARGSSPEAPSLS